MSKYNRKKHWPRLLPLTLLLAANITALFLIARFFVTYRFSTDINISYALICLLISSIILISGLAYTIISKNKHYFKLVTAMVEESPSKSEVQYRSVFENSGIGLMNTDEETTITLVNKEFEKVTGYLKDEVEGKMSWTILIPDRKDLERMKNYTRLRRIDPTLAPDVYTTRIKTKSGEIRDMMLHIIMAPGNTISMVYFIDITEQRHAEEALRESEEKYRSLVENMQDTLYRCDLQGHITFVSPSGLRLLGYNDAREPIGKNIAKEYYYDPDDRAALLRKLSNDGEVVDYEVTLKHKDGSPVQVLTNSHFFYDKDGKILGVEGIFTDITQRKRAEESVRSSKKLLNDILQAASEFSIIATDTRGVITAFNRGSERMLGYSAYEMVGKQSVLIIHKEAEISERGRELSSELGYPVEGFRIFVTKPEIDGSETREWTFVRKDGSTLAVSLVISAVRSEKGEITGYLGIANDITKRKQTEKILLEKEERLRAVTINIPGVVYQIYTKENGEYGISYVSERISEIFGIPTDPDNQFRIFVEHVYEEDRDRFLNSIREAKAIHAPWSFEGRFIRPSGEMIWFSGLATPSHHGDVPVYNGILLNITERRQAEEISRQSEEKFSKVFMLVPEMIGISRIEDGLIADVNAGFEEITGWKRNEAIGRTSLDIKFWVNPKERISMVEELRNGRDVLYREFQFGRKDGSVRAGIYSARTIEITGEKYLFFVMQDITERKHLEEERQKLEQQLLQSQKLDAIGELAGGIAHDFNNILTGIVGFTELSLNALNDRDKAMKYLKEVLASSERARALVNQILTFSRNSATELKEITPKFIIKEALKLIRASIPSTIDLRMMIKSESSILGDPTQLHQVIINLCANAAYALKDGKGEIEISLEDIYADEGYARLHPGLRQGKHILLKITDNGCGIKPDLIDRIFEPFFTTKPQGKGTGLGLSVVHGIVKKFNGIIKVYSEVDRGTTFNIILPVVTSGNIVIDMKQESSLPGGSERILLLDDELSIIDLLQITLKNLGYAISAFTDSVSAFAAFQKNPEGFDLVITDFTMPHMTGIDIAARIREISDVPIILCSGYLHKEIEQKAIKAGIGEVLSKPIRSEVLAKAIRKVLNKK